eukprot:gene13549-biopygen18563
MSFFCGRLRRHFSGCSQPKSPKIPPPGGILQRLPRTHSGGACGTAICLERLTERRMQRLTERLTERLTQRLTQRLTHQAAN